MKQADDHYALKDKRDMTIKNRFDNGQSVDFRIFGQIFSGGEIVSVTAVSPNNRVFYNILAPNKQCLHVMISEDDVDLLWNKFDVYSENVSDK